MLASLADTSYDEPSQRHVSYISDYNQQTSLTPKRDIINNDVTTLPSDTGMAPRGDISYVGLDQSTDEHKSSGTSSNQMNRSSLGDSSQYGGGGGGGGAQSQQSGGRSQKTLSCDHIGGGVLSELFERVEALEDNDSILSCVVADDDGELILEGEGSHGDLSQPLHDEDAVLSGADGGECQFVQDRHDHADVSQPVVNSPLEHVQVRFVLTM